MWHSHMGVEVGLAAPVLVEDEDAGVGCIDVEVVVEAAGFGSGGRDLGGEERREAPRASRAWR